MSWSYANIDWNGTGAMVQAVGSVAAILVAVRVDQGAARRLANDRRAAEADLYLRQLSALIFVRSALDRIQGLMPDINARNDPSAPLEAVAEGRRRLVLLDRYIDQTNPDPHILLAVLAARDAYEEALGSVRVFVRAPSARNRELAELALAGAAHAMRHVEDDVARQPNGQRDPTGLTGLWSGFKWLTPQRLR